MASYNRVILIGNLTRDPEVRYIPSGTAVSELGLAVNRTWFDKQSNSRKEETTFVDVTLWGREAEVAGEYLSKGRPVLIEGRLQLDSWEDKQSGQRRSKLRVVCERMQMLGSRGDGGGGGSGGGQSSGGQSSGGGGYGGGSSQSGYGGGDPGPQAPPQDADFGPSGGGPSSSGPSGGSVPDDEVPF